MTARRWSDWTLRLAALLGIVVATAAPAAAAGEDIATLEAASGRLSVLRLGQPQALTPSMTLKLNDIIVTREGRATVRFLSDGTVLRIGPDSRVQVDEKANQREVTVFFGRIWAHVMRLKERSTQFKTGSTIAAIRGTELSVGVAVDGDETQVSVLEGKVQAQTDAGSLDLGPGQVAVGKKGRAPALTLQVKPLDAVRWALYYPPVATAQPSQAGAAQAKVAQAAAASEKGDLAGALESLEGIDTKDIKDPGFFNYRASLLLGAGKVEDAAKDLEQALRLAPNDSDALALQTVVEVASNQGDKAVATAKRAVVAGPKSATALIAQSYAQQAKFDLEGARASLEAAVKAEPGEALAWARLAEIRSSLGQQGQALEAAEKAVSLAPNLSRTQTVLGFSHLTQVHTGAAKEAFQKAIEFDKGDPLPRLGMGLAKIREGDLAEGTRELEVATSLDPGQSLVRSYLGKAYFEGKRTGLDTREYDVAQQADPKDPTSHFYEAITKQTTNQPVEALRDVQEAIELNDNRAVYRSRLLLDQDLAARSAGLGRIYSDLGFQDRALVEGWNSVNTDPSNYSAHRFLADSYAALPRHEIARVSELFQSQLLQPLNMTPIQPRLSESNLFLVSAGGPGALSFNEFNPLFNRDGVNLQASGVLGEDGLWSGEGVFAGIYKKLSFSAGYSQFETDGWREDQVDPLSGETVPGNAFQNDKLGNAFLQLELTPQTSLQAEYRHRDQTYGDLQQRFYTDAYLPGMTNEEQRDTFRVGGRHALSSNSVLLASFTYQDSDIRSKVEFGGPDFYIESIVPQESYGTEVQHVYRSRRVNLTSGVGYFKIDGENQARLVLEGVPEELPTLPTKFDHVNAYVYANFKPAPSFTLTAGGSFDHLSGDLPGDGGDQFNPKLGLMWNPAPSTTVRAAAFRALKRTLVTDQTLEPTQVAGFNQFFDDSDLTEGWRYGGGIDQKFGRNVFGGFEFSMRDLTVPFIDLESVTQEALWDESMARAYLFATPHRWLGLRAQYIFEKFERDEECDGSARECLTVGFRNVETQRLPLGISFFHPSGLSASLTATYWHQEGLFEQLEVIEFAPGTSNFWLFDAAVNFRLPKRFGFISVGATNLFDKDFAYFEVDFDNPTILPTRTVFAKITLAVP